VGGMEVEPRQQLGSCLEQIWREVATLPNVSSWPLPKGISAIINASTVAAFMSEKQRIAIKAFESLRFEDFVKSLVVRYC
jgi:hypothetical protein